MLGNGDKAGVEDMRPLGDGPGDLDLRRGRLLPLLLIGVLLGLVAGCVRRDEIQSFACGALPHAMTCGAEEFRLESAILADPEAGTLDFRRVNGWTRVCLTTQYQDSDDRFYDHIAGEAAIRHEGRRIRGPDRIDFRVFDAGGRHLGHSVTVRRPAGAPRPIEYGTTPTIENGRQCALVAEAFATCEAIRGPGAARCLLLFPAPPE